MQIRLFGRDIYYWLTMIVAIIIALMPFHAFLTVWFSQLFGHYTAIRLWKEVLLLVLICGGLFQLACDAPLRQRFLSSWIVRLIGAFLAVQVVGGAVAYALHAVTLKALGYGLISDTRYGIFFLAVWLAVAKVPSFKKRWQHLVIWPLVVVVLIGLMQYFILPYDVLKHFGYNSTTIFPYEDINSNLRYIRIMSTLRGANPLGAYLATILCVVIALRRVRAWWWYGLMTGGLMALVLTFSRGAWIGFASGSAVLVVAYMPFRSRRWQLRLGIAGAVLVVACIGTFVFVHHNAALQNIFLHTEATSAIKTTSNGGHASALAQGLHDVVREPFGRGTGTAGPASVYNTGHPARIAENYYIQIAQETGWIGLALFLAMNIAADIALWRRRDNPLALGLCAGLVSASFMGLLSHVWADDTLAYIWWGLAAVALAPAILQTKAEHTHGPQKTTP